MSDSTEEKVSTKLSRSLLLELEAAAIEARKTLGRKPTYSEMLENAWDVFKESKSQIVPKADVQLAVDMLQWMRNPGSAEMKRFCEFVLEEYERRKDVPTEVRGIVDKRKGR